jgi:hypothetical protein
VPQVFVNGDEMIASDVVFTANNEKFGDFHRETGEWPQLRLPTKTTQR